jgi:lipid-A-disaccharide synthase
VNRSPRIFISAGEASGDRLGAGLALALRARRPGIELMGMGGSRMAAAGVRIVQDSAEVSVVGLFEVLGRLPTLYRAMGRLRRVLRDERPDLVVPVDFPDFNLRLSRHARRAAIDVVYFVSPQVWAWRAGRIRLLRRLVRRILVLFPFEEPFYLEAGVPVTFVGHPMAEGMAAAVPPEVLRRHAGLRADGEVVALLPGSRSGEIARLLPVMLEAARVMLARRPDLHFLLCAAPAFEQGRFAAALEAPGLTGRVHLHAGDFPQILTTCQAGIVASGTASLEAAVMGLPIVVVYRLHPFSYALGRLLVSIEHIALPNLIAQRRVVPELVQSDCTPERISEEVLRYLEHPNVAEGVRSGLAQVRERLGPPGIFDRAAEAVLQEWNTLARRP